MTRKCIFYLSMLLIIAFIGPTSCKDDEEENETPVTADNPIFYAGQIVTSEISKDDVVIELMIDTVVNLGRDERPALFFVNQSHTLNGQNIGNGNHYANVFRSVSRQRLHEFIVLWGKLIGVEINLNDLSPESISKRQEAFYVLSQFLIRFSTDLPMLIALCQNTAELQAAVDIVNAANSALKSSSVPGQYNEANSILRSLEVSGIKPTEFMSAVNETGMTPEAYFSMANEKGINLAASIQQGNGDRGIVTAVIKAVCKAVVYISKFIVFFIEHGAPSVDLEDSYTSYLHQDDTDPMDYISGQPYQTSPTYSVKYCTLATASFYIETNYDAHHQTLPGQYINRCGMIVKSVKCSGGMHVEGYTEWGTPVTIGTNENPIATSSNTVIVNYGDCCCFSRHAKLTFDLTGNLGYDETSWDSNTK